MVSSIQEALDRAKTEIFVTAEKFAAEFNAEQKKEKSKLVRQKEFVPGNSVLHKLVLKDFSEHGHPLKLTWKRRDQFAFIYDYFKSIKLLEDGHSINANEYRVFKNTNRQQWAEYFHATEAKISLIRRIANEIVAVEKKMVAIHSWIADFESRGKQ